MTPGTRRWRALGGVAGPAAFIAAWAILGTSRSGYSPVHDPISELAAFSMPSRLAMTCGFVAFGAGVSLYATEIGSALPGGVSLAAASTAVATLGVAAWPLGSTLGDGPHGAVAALGYATLALTPLVGARSLARQGRRGPAAASVAIGIAAGAALLTSTVVSQRVGLWQRIGLTLVDAWIMTTALWLASRAPARNDPEA